MIRLTVEQLNALQKSIQDGGQVNATVLPLNAMVSHRLVIAWAKGRSAGEGLYLSIWKSQKSWEDAIAQDQAGVDPPYDYINDDQSMDYTHTYPVEDSGTALRFRPNETQTDNSGHPEFGVTHGE